MNSKEEKEPERSRREQEAPHAGKSPSSRPQRSERRAEFRVSDDQRSGRGAQSAWSRMSMLERRKQLWIGVRHKQEI